MPSLFLMSIFDPHASNVAAHSALSHACNGVSPSPAHIGGQLEFHSALRKMPHYQQHLGLPRSAEAISILLSPRSLPQHVCRVRIGLLMSCQCNLLVRSSQSRVPVLICSIDRNSRSNKLLHNLQKTIAGSNLNGSRCLFVRGLCATKCDFCCHIVKELALKIFPRAQYASQAHLDGAGTVMRQVVV